MEKRFQFEVSDYVKIEIIGLVKTPMNCVCGIHRHPFWELIYTKAGEGIHQFPSGEITLRQDEICLIPPGVLHDCRNEKPAENVKLYIGYSYHYSLSGDAPQEASFLSGSVARLPALRD